MPPDDGADSPSQTVVLATANSHKLREIAEMLRDAPFRLIGLDSFPQVILPPETEDTFEGNAAVKAAAAARQTGMIAIGDDSGLEVEALDGRPGILSARFAGAGATDEANLNLLLQLMAGVPDGDRGARFVCALAIAAPDGKLSVSRGVCEGRITSSPRGANGFGYDPIFLIVDDGRTLAQFSAAEKNAISHRYHAVRTALPRILNALAGIEFQE